MDEELEKETYRIKLPSNTEWLIGGGAIEHSSFESTAIRRVDNWQERMTRYLSKWEEKFPQYKGKAIPTDWLIAYRELELGGGYIPVEHTKESILGYLKSVHSEENPRTLDRAAQFMLVLTGPAVQHVKVSSFEPGSEYPDRED